ncbi:MAG TPA: MMPL family transporter [Nevskiaceae bacterium]|nr:MMPL family transporter [Nevskiaceae bacterium]
MAADRHFPTAPGRPAAAALWVATHSRAVLALVAFFTLLALLQLVDWSGPRLRLAIDPSLDSLSALDDETRAFEERVRTRFGGEDTVLVLLRREQASAPAPLSGAGIRRLRHLTESLAALPGVVGAQSLATAALPRQEDDTLVLRALGADDEADPGLAERLAATVRDNPLLEGQLVAPDLEAVAVAIEIDHDAAVRGDGALARALIATADAAAGSGYRAHVTGSLLVRAATNEAVAEQLRSTLPAVILLLSGLLAAAFRSWRGVLLPLATIGLALLWTAAVCSALGRSLNLVTSLVPPLLATMGLAYCAHVLSEFEALSREPEYAHPGVRIRQLLRDIAGPVMLTGFTTGLGLLALSFNAVPAIREFAWLSALGVFFTMVLALSFLPAMLRLTATGTPTRMLPGEAWLQAQSERLGRFDLRFRRGILLGAGLLMALAVLSASRVQVGDSFVGIFPEDARVRVDFETISRELGGVTPLSVIVEGGPNSLVEPANLRALDALERWIEQQPEVGHVVGLPDHLKQLNRLLSGGPAVLPDSRGLAKQLMFFGDARTLAGVVDRPRASTRLAMRLTVDDTVAISAFLDRLQPQLEALPPGLRARVSGEAASLARSVETVTDGQISGIGLALLVIYGVLSLQFLSAWIGFLATLPTLLQTGLYFGALGIAGVPLNATTSLVECLVLGLAVDDTIHYLARFNAAAKRCGSETDAAVSALGAVLRPISLTKAILAAGFLTLTLGELENQIVFGWLAAFTLLAAWLVDVLVTPAFMSGVRVVSLWDSLRVNLGRHVQSTIPLFAGLSDRQARLFALMSRLESYPPGHRLMTEGESAGGGTKGDPAGDAFVLIDGECRVWIEREGREIELNRVGRGAVLGETGYFGQKRQANVDTLGPVRLLRFDDADQERICRRYPAVAARVFLNLNRIQAERRSQTAALMAAPEHP